MMSHRAGPIWTDLTILPRVFPYGTRNGTRVFFLADIACNSSDYLQDALNARFSLVFGQISYRMDQDIKMKPFNKRLRI